MARPNYADPGEDRAERLTAGQLRLARLKLSAEMLTLLQTQIPADTAAAVYAACVMEGVRQLEDVLTEHKLIPKATQRSGPGRHIP